MLAKLSTEEPEVYQAEFFIGAGMLDIGKVRNNVI